MARPKALPQELLDAITEAATDSGGVISVEKENALHDWTEGFIISGIPVGPEDIKEHAQEMRELEAAHKETTRALALTTLDGALSNEELTNITATDIAALMSSAQSADELGIGFRMVKEKNQLIAQPFFILNYRFSEGDISQFVTVFLVTDDMRKLMFTDGSTGVCKQLLDWTEKNDMKMTRLICKKGLRISDYPMCNNCKKILRGKPRECPQCGSADIGKGETFYIDETL